VYSNANSATKATIPYLLNFQCDLIDQLETRVVIPLYPANAMQGKTFQTLIPIVDIQGQSFMLMTPQLAGVPKKALGSVLTDLSAQRADIIAALDLLITGI